MRRSISKSDLEGFRIILKRVMYRYSNTCVTGYVLGYFEEGNTLLVELDNGKMIERDVKSWEIFTV